MVELNDYEKILLLQKNPATGCIPSAIEWMMRYKKIEVPENFQEKYDLKANGKGENNFKTVSDAVHVDYQDLNFEFREFKNGKEKFAYIEDTISKQIPCLMAIYVPYVGFHSVPVVEINTISVFYLSMQGWSIEQQLERNPRGGLEWAHNNRPGGKDALALL